MECIYCSHKTQVINSRPQKRLRQVWRRRQCTHCKAVFTTLETVDTTTSLLVTDKTGHSEPFQRDKLFVSLLSACGHRKTAQRDAAALTNTTLAKLYPQIVSATISAATITETALEVLKRFDKAAAVQYAAYHR